MRVPFRKRKGLRSLTKPPRNIQLSWLSAFAKGKYYNKKIIELNRQSTELMNSNSDPSNISLPEKIKLMKMAVRNVEARRKYYILLLSVTQNHLRSLRASSKPKRKSIESMERVVRKLRMSVSEARADHHDYSENLDKLKSDYSMQKIYDHIHKRISSRK